MSQAVAVASREFCAFFRVPLGWVVIALYLALSGAVFAFLVVAPGEPATLRPFFGLSGWVLMFVAPAVSMRVFSDEYRAGTIEPLMTAPVADWLIVAGKYLAGASFLLAMFLPTLLFVGVLEALADPDYGPIASGYLGLLLTGLLYLALGTLCSALTSSQTLAFLGTLFTLLLVRLATADAIAQRAPESISRALTAMSIDRRLGEFSRGVIDTGDVVFFLAAVVWLLALAVVALQSRRWR